MESYAEQRAGENTSRDTRESPKSTSGTICIEGNGTRASHNGDGYKESDVMYTLNTVEQHAVCSDTKGYNISSYNSNSMKSNNPHNGIKACEQSRTIDTNGNNPACNQGGTVLVKCIGNGQVNQLGLSDKVGALNCMHEQQGVIYALDRASFNQGKNAKYDFKIEEDKCSTLVARGPSAVLVKD